MNSLDALARAVYHLQRQVRANNRPRLAHSTIEDGALRERDRDGNLRGIYGRQFDGTHAALSVGGPTPPEPSPMILVPVVGGVYAEWDGTFVGGAIVPSDFSRVEYHLSDDPNLIADVATTLRATCETPRGVGHFVPQVAGSPPQYGRLVCRSLSGGLSPASAVVGPVSALGIGVADLAVTAEQLVARRLTWGTIQPVSGAVGELWLDTTTPTAEVLWRWEGGAWVVETNPDMIAAAIESMVADDEGILAVPTLVAYEGIVAKTIKADLLEAVMVLVNTLVAGDQDSTHLTLNPEGLTAYLDGVDGPTQAIRLGTTGSDFLSISNALGVILASINDLGGIQAVDFAVQNWPEIGSPDWSGAGGRLNDILDRRGRGIVAFGEVAIDGPMSSVNSVGWFDIGGVLHPGRMYRLTTSPISVESSAGADSMTLQVWYESAPEGDPVPSPTTASPYLTKVEVGVPAGIAPDSRSGAINYLFHGPETVSESWRFLLGYQSEALGGGSVFTTANESQWAQMWVEDVGPDRQPLEAINDGSSSSEPPPPEIRTVAFPALWSATYIENGDKLVTNEATQGKPNGLVSERKGLIGFGNLSTALAGAVISRVELKLHAITWRPPSGGTAVIGTHNYLTEPATYTTGADEDLQRELNFPRNATRYIDITALDAANWVTGDVKGIVLGDTLGGDGIYYGRFAGSADASLRPELIITYVV